MSVTSPAATTSTSPVTTDVSQAGSGYEGKIEDKKTDGSKDAGKAVKEGVKGAGLGALGAGGAAVVAELITSCLTGEPINWKAIITSALGGAVGGGLGGGLGQYFGGDKGGDIGTAAGAALGGAGGNAAGGGVMGDMGGKLLSLLGMGK